MCASSALCVVSFLCVCVECCGKMWQPCPIHTMRPLKFQNDAKRLLVGQRLVNRCVLDLPQNATGHPGPVPFFVPVPVPVPACLQDLSPHFSMLEHNKKNTHAHGTNIFEVLAKTKKKRFAIVCERIKALVMVSTFSLFTFNRVVWVNICAPPSCAEDLAWSGCRSGIVPCTPHPVCS